MHWHTVGGFVCPHCGEVLIIRYFTVHQEIGITIHSFCSSCIYAEGPKIGQNVTFQHELTYDGMFAVARELDDKKNKCVSDVDELAGYEQQMHDFLELWKQLKQEKPELFLPEDDSA